jgi:FkbM family methyltransferase
MKKVILDIGANSGYFSEYILINDNSSNVIAFEPNPKFEPNSFEHVCPNDICNYV